MPADDERGSERELAEIAPYESAFAEIDANPHHLLVVREPEQQVLACLHATLLPCLTHGGSRRVQFEGIRVSEAQRGKGVGHALLRWSIVWAENQGCGFVQLTTDKRRPAALRFYESLGFAATHEGMKLPIAAAQ